MYVAQRGFDMLHDIEPFDWEDECAAENSHTSALDNSDHNDSTDSSDNSCNPIHLRCQEKNQRESP